MNAASQNLTVRWFSALALALLCSTPALAHDDDDGYWRPHHHHHHHGWNRPYYAPPPVYYAPPPVYVPPRYVQPQAVISVPPVRMEFPLPGMQPGYPPGGWR